MTERKAVSGPLPTPSDIGSPQAALRVFNYAQFLATWRKVVEEFTATISQQVGAGPFSAPLGKLAAFL